jgi:hypothetical protein
MAGFVTYKGELGIYLPLPGVTEKTHLGKNTSFVLRKIMVDRSQ